jgi:hypothetical protein
LNRYKRVPGGNLDSKPKGIDSMSTSALPQGEVKQWRVIVFVIVAGLFALLLLYVGVRDLMLLSGQPGFPSDIHRWHEAQSGTLTAILFGGSFLALLWRPQRKPLLLVFVALGIVFVSLSFATVSGSGFNPIALGIGVALIGILVAAYPAPRALLKSRREGSPCYLLPGLTIMAAIVLAPIMARELNWQILGMTEHDMHALNYHWLTSVLLALLLILAGSLSATKRAGWKALSFITGVAYCYLGVAALMMPDHAGSWGTIGGVLGLLAGSGYITASLIEAGHTKKTALVTALAQEAIQDKETDAILTQNHRIP